MKGQEMIEFHILIEKEGRLYSALCLELNIASQGRTLHEAEKNIREAIGVYLEDVLEAGDEKDFVPRPAPTQEWLKYFNVEAKKLKSFMKKGTLKPKFIEAVIG